MNLSMSQLAGKTVVLGVTGGIAAYKAAELCRLLVKAGARVRVVMTPAATEFMGALTFQTLSGAPVGLALLDSDAEARIGHIQLGDEADVIVVAPASADAIARMAAGMADDLLTAVVLASRAPVLLAPAMNVNMWQNPLTQQNLGRLVGTGRFFTVGPDSGELACGWVGAGRLIEPPEIVERVERLLRPQDLAGRRVVVTAGPTIEPIDDVRFIGNRSSGKMGFALAAAAASRGAEVTLIAGPVAPALSLSLGWPPARTVLGGADPGGHPVVRRDVETTEEMRVALREAVPGSDVVIMAAAVADFRPAARAPGKLSRRGRGPSPGPGPLAAASQAPSAPPSSVELVANPDLLAELGRSRRGGRPMLVGFAAEAGGTAEAMVARAREKLVEKGCDLVVANDITAAGIGFGSDENAVTLVYGKFPNTIPGPVGGATSAGPAPVGPDGSVETLARAPKLEIAHAILDRLAARLPPRDTTAVPVRRASRTRTGAPPARPPTFGPANVHGRRRRG
jgi:phosphopantothenoylcysteine decarboxylase/phosphopantothenate--cysteine ligase